MRFAGISLALTLIALLAGVGLATGTPPVGHTPPPEQISAATAATRDIDIHSGAGSRVLVQRMTLPAGGTTGWHSHPIYHLVSIISGTAVIYDYDGVKCTRSVYGPGQAIPHRPGDVHDIRNEGTTDVVTSAVQIIPPGTNLNHLRIDKPAPHGPGCPHS